MHPQWFPILQVSVSMAATLQPQPPLEILSKRKMLKVMPSGRQGHLCLLLLLFLRLEPQLFNATAPQHGQVQLPLLVGKNLPLLLPLVRPDKQELEPLPKVLHLNQPDRPDLLRLLLREQELHPVRLKQLAPTELLSLKDKPLSRAAQHNKITRAATAPPHPLVLLQQLPSTTQLTTTMTAMKMSQSLKIQHLLDIDCSSHLSCLQDVFRNRARHL
jgi:hypothetical protein